jgi:hypothetical protein
MRGSRVRRSLIAGGLAVMAGVGLSGRVVQASPITAKVIKIDVTNAFNPCTASDTTTGSGGFNACLNPTLADSLCTFKATGKGKVKLIAEHGDVFVYGALTDLTPACEGQMLEMDLSARLTTDDCPPAASPAQACTLVDFTDHALGTCQVSNGRCRLVTSLNATISQLIEQDHRTHIEFNGCSFKRITGGSLPTRTFSCGIAVP